VLVPSPEDGNRNLVSCKCFSNLVLI
jgi:hypothetical protein